MRNKTRNTKHKTLNKHKEINSKHQAPNNKQIPSTKHQISNSLEFGILNLEFVWNLRFGIWNLFKNLDFGFWICLGFRILDLWFTQSINHYSLFAVRYLLLFVIFNLLSVISLNAGSWNKWKKDIYGTNNIFETAKEVKEGNLLWEYNVFSNVLASPVVYKEKVYVATRSGAIYCFDATTGEVIWQESVGGQINSTPEVLDNRVYIPSFDGNIYCFDALTGEILWSYSTTSSEPFSSPLIFNNILLFAPGFGNPDYQNYLVALNLDGSFKWRFNTGNLVHSSPITDGKDFYIASNNGKIFKIDSLGNEKWNYQTEGSFRMATPAYKDGKIFFAPGDNERSVFAIDKNGSILWSSSQLNTAGEGMIVSSITLDEKNLYLVYTTTKEWIASLSQNDGSILWQLDLGKTTNSNYIASPSIANGRIFVPAQSGYIFEISTDGVILNNFLVENSSSPIYTTPAISDGKIYFATWSGFVKCYKTDEIVSISYPEGETISGLVEIKGWIESKNSLNWSIYYSTDNANFVFISSGTNKVLGSTITLWNTSLLSDGTYYLKILSTNGYALSSCYLDNPPSPPSNLTAIDNPFDEGGEIKLSWNLSPQKDVLGYKIYRSTSSNFSLLTTVSNSTTYYIDTGLIDHVTYYYYLKSYDSINESTKTETVSAYPLDNLSPEPPTNFYLIQGDGFIDLFWDYSASLDVSFYEIYKSTDNSYFLKISTLSSTTKNYRDEDVLNHTTYYYYLTSVDDAGNISSKTTTEFTYPYEGADSIPPSNITTLTSYSTIESEVKLFWLSPGDDGTSGDVLGGGWKIEASTISNFSILSYSIEISTFYSYLEPQEFKITGLTPLLTYYFRVIAFDNAGRSSVSNTSTTTVFGISPSPITDLKAETGDIEGSINLYWSSAGDDGTTGNFVNGGFEIENSTDSNFLNPYKIVVSSSFSPGEKHKFNVTGLIKGVTYYFRIFSFDEWGLKSESSNIASALSQPDATPPEDVTNFSVKDTENDFGGSLTLTWNKSKDDGSGENDVINYYIYRSTNSNFSNSKLIILKSGTTYYVDTNLTDEIEYYYRIKSYDGWNFSKGKEGSGIPTSNWKNLSTDGGSLTLDNEVEIEVPEGSYSEKLYFFVRNPEPTEYNSSSIPEFVKETDIVKEILVIKESEKNLLSGRSIDYMRSYVKSRELKFNKNIILKISYKNASYSNANLLRLFYLDENKNLWLMIHNSYPNLSSEKVIASVPHFSYFRIMEFRGAPYLIDKNRCYVYPQPATGDELFFKFYLGNVCKVKIKIFNVSGDMIKVIEKDYSLIDIGKAQSIKWDITNVAGGVYIWVLEAEGSGKKEVIKKKLGIVH